MIKNIIQLSNKKYITPDGILTFSVVAGSSTYCKPNDDFEKMITQGWTHLECALLLNNNFVSPEVVLPNNNLDIEHCWVFQDIGSYVPVEDVIKLSKELDRNLIEAE